VRRHGARSGEEGSDLRKTWSLLSFVAGKNLAIFGQQREHRPDNKARWGRVIRGSPFARRW